MAVVRDVAVVIVVVAIFGLLARIGELEDRADTLREHSLFVESQLQQHMGVEQERLERLEAVAQGSRR